MPLTLIRFLIEFQSKWRFKDMQIFLVNAILITKVNHARFNNTASKEESFSITGCYWLV